MAISTYAELQSAVADWAQRDDLTDRIPDFIALAEARMSRKLRLRLFELDVPYTTIAGQQTLALPADYREPKNLWLNWAGTRQALNFIPASLLQTTTSQCAPLYWGINGANIQFQAPCDQAYSLTFRYMQKLSLSDATPTNALLTNYPDAYLTTTLAEACRFLKDPDGAKIWDDKANQIAHDIREEEERTNSLATLHTEPGQLTRGGRGFNIFRGW